MKETPETKHVKRPPDKYQAVNEVGALKREMKLLNSMPSKIKETFINKIQIEPEDLEKIYDKTPEERLQYLEEKFIKNNSPEESLEEIVRRINESLEEFEKNKKLTPPQE